MTVTATAELLEDVRAFVARYVVLPSEQAADAIALWALHTWALDAAHATPYLLVVSPEKRSGKTRLLEVLELLAARPWRLFASSEAAMFRKIAEDRPTLLLDEVDAIFASHSERTEPLRALLNAGNRPGSRVARCVGQGEQRVVDFDVYCPKVLAGIDTGRLPETIRDRGIEIRMHRKTGRERVERFRHRHAEAAAGPLRGQLEAWGVWADEALRDADPELPEALSDRTAEAWEPLCAIADDAGGEWPRRAREAAVVLAASSSADEAASSGSLALAKLADLLRDRAAVTTEEALDALNADEELPFGAWRDGRGLDSRGLARLLRPYGIRPQTVRVGDSTAKGYRRDEAVEEAFARYVTPPGIRHNAADASRENPLHERVVTDVTHVTAISERGEGSRDEPPAELPTVAAADEDRRCPDCGGRVEVTPRGDWCCRCTRRVEGVIA